MVLVAAPAGYGKTTFLAQWEDADERPFAWISLDERYDDPLLLLGSIAAAVDEIEPLDDGVFAPLLSPVPDVSNVVVPRVCQALRELERPFVIVLDDLHKVHNPEALGPLPELAASLNAGSTLAITSREEPEMPLGRLRTQRRLGEVGARDLVMTPAEAADLLEEAGLELDGPAVERLVERTEGWPAGLYLAALALGTEDDVERAVEDFYGDDRLVADYVRDAFLEGLPAFELDFLTRTSLLDRLSGPLCDAILERDGSAEILRHLARSNMLLVPLDRRDLEYRYHSLLQEMLRAELQRQGRHLEAPLHERASRWYAEHDDIDHAVKHAIAAGNRDRAGELIWANTAGYASRGRNATLRRWLAEFSDREIAESPALCLTAATTSLSAGDGARVEHWTAAAAEGVKAAPSTPESVSLESAARVIRAAGAARDGVVQMRADVVDAYDLLAGRQPVAVAVPPDSRGTSYHLTGDRQTARTLLEEGSRRGGAAAPHVQTLCLAQLALISLDESDHEQAYTSAELAMAEVTHFAVADYPTSGLVFAVAALVRARSGRTRDASADLRKATELMSQPERDDALVRGGDQGRHRPNAAPARRRAGRASPARAGRPLPAASRRRRRHPRVDRDGVGGDRHRRLRRGSLAPEPRRAAAAPLPPHPPDVPRDRRRPLRLREHGQDAGAIDLPQARGLLARGGGRLRARRRPPRRDGPAPAVRLEDGLRVDGRRAAPRRGPASAANRPGGHGPRRRRRSERPAPRGAADGG